jgi:NADPH:quinone reductase-like Zn-dependent oxidoreductase
MKLRYKIGGTVLVLLAIAFGALAYGLSHDKPCEPAPALDPGAARMQAVVYRCYGPPDVLQLEEIEKPTPGPKQLLVKVHAASVNPLDWHMMRGEPYLMRAEAGMGRPAEERFGVDFAGVVEATGQEVSRFKAGDEVFGMTTGTFAQYVLVGDSRSVTLKPPQVSFEDAAAAPVAALTALQALRDAGRIRPGQKVLINGASGGVGTYAVQIAKSYGAEVTGVCSTRNIDLVKSLGADHVIDYTKENFTESGKQYDLIIDNVGSHSLQAYRQALPDDGVFVIVGGQKGGKWLGPMTSWIRATALSPFVSQDLMKLMTQGNQKDLDILGDLMREGKVRSVIDRRYGLNEVRQAVAYVEEGHARAKVVINVQ